MSEDEHAKEATEGNQWVVSGEEGIACFDSTAQELLRGVQASWNTSATRASSEERP